MAAYGIATYRITDAEGYAQYPPAFLPTLMKAGGEILAADYSPDVREGSSPDVVVILKFPSKEVAQAWYDSDEYQAIKPLRVDHTTDIFTAIVDGFEMPA